MHFKRLFALLILTLGLGLSAHAADPQLVESTSTRFNFAHQLLKSGDESRDKGDTASAIILYGEALKEYDSLIREYPDWDSAISRFRVDYCRDQLRTLQAKPANASLPADTKSTSPLPPTSTSLATPPPPDFTPSPLEGEGRGEGSTTQAVSTNVTPSLEALSHQASTLLRDGQAEAARVVLLDALRVNPDDVSSRLMIGVAQCTLGNYQDALYVLEPLAEEQPTMAAIPLALGAAYLGLGDPERALTVVRQAVTLDDASAEGHYNLAHVLMVLSPTNAIEAQAHYHRAVELGLQPDPKLEALLSQPAAPSP